MNERLPYLQDKTQRLTTSPGVYLMKDKSSKIIYVGKAKNLKNRVTSYFRLNANHTPKVAKMVEKVNDYDFIVTDTEYEALILECSLIKQYMPLYNILLKDDKGYHYIKISDEEYPKITAEKHKDNDNAKYLGPYTSSYVAKQTVNEVNRVFMLPTCRRKFPDEIEKVRPCLNYYINQCMGICNGGITSNQYKAIIEESIEYIKKGSSNSVERMQLEMVKASEALDFEHAAYLRDRINAIKSAADTQKIITNMKDTDVIGIAENEGNICVSILLYRNGRLYDKNVYFLGEEDEELLESFMLQYYVNKDDIPRDILIEKDIRDTEIVTQLLKETSKHVVNIQVPKIGNGLKLIMLAKNNASEYLSFKVGRTGKEIVALEELGKILGMKNSPKYIEAYDISNLGSDSMVAGMIVFKNGRPYKNAYKRFSIKENEGQNDVGCMREVIERRFKHYNNSDDEGFNVMPDLILLDGGKGQVNAVELKLREMGIDVPIYGMVKDNNHRTRAIATGGNEISISDIKSAFFLVTRIQDEVHRFAISYQRKKHEKGSYQLGITGIKGIGEKKAIKLFQRYKTKEALKNASAEELAAAAGVGIDIAKKLYEYLQNNA